MFIETSPSVYFNLNSAIKIKFNHCIFEEPQTSMDGIYHEVVVYTPLIDKNGKRVVYMYQSVRDEAIYIAIQNYVDNNKIAREEYNEDEEETVEWN